VLDGDPVGAVSVEVVQKLARATRSEIERDLVDGDAVAVARDEAAERQVWSYYYGSSPECAAPCEPRD